MQNTKIFVNYGDITKIASMLKVSFPTVRKALRGDFDSNNPKERDLALRIRQCALNLGAIESK